MTLRGKMIEARWSEMVREALPDGEVVFSTGRNDYQGSVAIVAKLDDGRWLHYDWSYGSCSGCDHWENVMGWDDDAERRQEVINEIQNGAAIMDAAHFADYLCGIKAAGADWLHDDSDRSEGSYYSYEDHVGMSLPDLMTAVGVR